MNWDNVISFWTFTGIVLGVVAWIALILFVLYLGTNDRPTIPAWLALTLDLILFLGGMTLLVGLLPS